MFAVVRTGGKQYRVAAGDKIVVEKIGGEAGETVRLDDVLFSSGGATGGLVVSAQIIAQAKADKVIVFKKRRRHNYRRKNGHRQQHTILRITAVGDAQAGTASGADASMAHQEIVPVTDDAQNGAPAAAATKPARAPKAKAEPQAPLKVEGAESPLTDTPLTDSPLTDSASTDSALIDSPGAPKSDTDSSEA